MNKNTYSKVKYTRRPRAHTQAQPDTRKQNIQSAFEEGMLLAHMLEFGASTVPSSELIDLCNVMDSCKDACFKNEFSKYESTPQGIRGLASSALAKDVPGNLWDFYSSIGLLFDGRDRNNVNVEHFFPFDAQSNATYGQLKYGFMLKADQVGKELHDKIIQQTDVSKDERVIQHPKRILDLNKDNINERHALATEVLQDFWRARKEGILPNFKANSQNISPESLAFLNETTISAKLAGVKGIVVKNMKEDPASQNALKNAVSLSQWLSADYPHAIPTPPPVMLYDGLKMTEMEPSVRANIEASLSRRKKSAER